MKFAAAATFLLWTTLELAGLAQEGVEVRTVRFRTDSQLREITGEVLVEAADNGILLQGPDGRQWLIQPGEIENQKDSPDPLTVLTPKELGEQLLKEMPSGFKILETEHYVIGYNTSQAYARWTSNLLERLYRGFYSYWKKRGLELKEPRFPLSALVFDTRESYQEYARKEIGDGVDSIIGYYNLQTNRITTFDLTGVEGLVPNNAKLSTNVLVNEVLKQPAAERTVATVVHEAFHQLAYNSGLQVRLADNPFWVSEGLAVFFEAPDFGSSTGWSTIGKVNQFNYRAFSSYFPTRPTDSLVTLLRDDSRFRDPKLATAAYAEAWALNYYLLKRRSKEYAKYLELLSHRLPLGQSTEKDRLAEFQSIFGEDLAKFDQQFIQFMQNSVR